MRKSSIGYYAPTKLEYEKLWSEGVFVFDTNVLLDIYRLPQKVRGELLSTMSALKGRVWLPFQVLLEFQRRRLGVVSGESKKVRDELENVKKKFDEILAGIDKLKIDERDLGVDVSSLKQSLSEVKGKVSGAIEGVLSSLPGISQDDKVRDELDKLFDGRVGVRPSNQEQLDNLCIDGNERYADLVPPGYMDAEKDRNPREAIFVFDGLKYERKFGDLIIWRQLLDRAKTDGWKSIVFVTSDKKEDWWWEEAGKKLGPRPELMREILEVAGVELFWMYSTDSFLKYANTYGLAKISEASVQKVEEITSSADYDGDLPENHLAFFESSSAAPRNRLRNKRDFLNFSRFAKLAVKVWLEKRFGGVLELDGFPDLVAYDGGNLVGYEVKRARSFADFLLSYSPVGPEMGSSSRPFQGCKEIVLVLCVEEFSEPDVRFLNGLHNSKILGSCFDAIIVGRLDEDSGFSMALEIGLRDGISVTIP